MIVIIGAVLVTVLVACVIFIRHRNSPAAAIERLEELGFCYQNNFLARKSLLTDGQHCPTRITVIICPHVRLLSVDDMDVSKLEIRTLYLDVGPHCLEANVLYTYFRKLSEHSPAGNGTLYRFISPAQRLQQTFDPQIYKLKPSISITFEFEKAWKIATLEQGKPPWPLLAWACSRPKPLMDANLKVECVIVSGFGISDDPIVELLHRSTP